METVKENKSAKSLTVKEKLDNFLASVGTTWETSDFSFDDFKTIAYYGSKIMPEEKDRKAYGFYINEHGGYTYFRELVDIRLVLMCYGYSIVTDDFDDPLPENEWYVAGSHGGYIEKVSEIIDSPYGTLGDFVVMTESEMQKNSDALEAWLDYLPPVDERVDAEIERMQENVDAYLSEMVADIDFTENNMLGYTGAKINLYGGYYIENGELGAYDDWGYYYSSPIKESAATICDGFARRKYAELR